MTSLIDVIFLLLLFFMLSSTFTRFAEVELMSAESGGQASDATPVFVRLGETDLSVNGTPATLSALPDVLREVKNPVLVSLRQDASAQRLTDLLVALRAFPGLSVSVLGGT